jgi:hypothetical protein
VGLLGVSVRRTGIPIVVVLVGAMLLPVKGIEELRSTFHDTCKGVPQLLPEDVTA